MHRQKLAARPAIRMGWNTLLFLRAGVAASIPRFISLELLRRFTLCRGFFADFWPFAVVTVLRVEGVVHLALEVATAMKPWANADEDAAIEPFRSVIAVGNAVIRGIVIVTVWTIRSDSDFDADLSLYFGNRCRQEDSSNSS
jgi:hypothetical protein